MAKDIAIAHVMTKNILFRPELPSSVEGGEVEQMRAIQIRLVEDTNKREDYYKSKDRLEKWSHLLFVYMRDPILIGRAWQMLIIYLNMKFLQPTCQIIYHLIHITGDQLVLNYKKAFKTVLQQILSKWIPEYTAYCDINNENGMKTEI